MLKLEKVSTSIGNVEILHEIDMHVHEKEIVSVIGANGAGKSTLLNTLSGLYKPAAGTITLFGEQIGGLPAHRVVGKGLCLVPEGRQVFATLTVKENLLLGMYTHYYKQKRQAKTRLEKVLAMFPNLKKHLNSPAGLLSGGEQQMLAIGRGLMSNPKIMLLDEPSMGLAPMIVNEILANLVFIKEQLGAMVILVEQNVKAALNVADRVYVMDRGRVTMSGTTSEISRNPEIMSAYLGVKQA